MKKVDLHAMPYFLDDSAVAWVEDTMKSMTLEEKIGQLFINLFVDFDAEKVRSFLRQYPIGGARYMGAPGKDVQTLNRLLQKESKIPLLIAANCDAGGDGACKDGTYIAAAAAVEASGSEEVAYDVGFVSGKEATALGVNWNFDPCVDILTNWRNTIVNTRGYGTTKDPVIRYSRAYLKGLLESNVASCIKHFPGDGTEERDQHLLLGVNELSVDAWEESFGDVYRAHIEDGVQSIMAGHIALPHYQKTLVPGLKDEDILPATLAKELITDLLKDRMGFNGLVLTDASHMIGLAAAMRREDYVPGTIAAGCDMFLFFNDAEEDFHFMMEGYKKGVITEERLEDALRRILGLKAKLGLPQLQKENVLVPEEGALAIIGCEDHLTKAKNAADKAITLVKNTQDQLPIRPETHPRIRLYYLFGEQGGIHGGSTVSLDVIREELERVGFSVTLNDGSTRVKGKTLEYRDTVDAALVFADIQGYARENNVRIQWKTPMSNDIPWYVHEVPTVFVSLNFTNHLVDVPMVKGFVNSYKNTREVIRQTIQKLMGDAPFQGTPNENVWCSKWQTRL